MLLLEQLSSDGGLHASAQSKLAVRRLITSFVRRNKVGSNTLATWQTRKSPAVPPPWRNVPGPRSTYAPHELHYHLAPMRPCAMLDQVDSLPGSQRQAAVQDRNMQRRRSQHGLDVARHVVGAFAVVPPSGVLRRQPTQRGHQILQHGRIGIFLDRQRRRGMANE